MTGPQSASHPLDVIAPMAPDGAPASTAGLFGAALTSYLDASGDVPAAPPPVVADDTARPLPLLDIVARVAAWSSVPASESPDGAPEDVTQPGPGPAGAPEGVTQSPLTGPLVPAGASEHVRQPPHVPLAGAVEPSPHAAPEDVPPSPHVPLAGAVEPSPHGPPDDVGQLPPAGAREDVPPQPPPVSLAGGAGPSVPPAGAAEDVLRPPSVVAAAQPPPSPRAPDVSRSGDASLGGRTQDALSAPVGDVAAGRGDPMPAGAAPAGTARPVELPVADGHTPSTATEAVEVARRLEDDANAANAATAATGANATSGRFRRDGPTRSDVHAARAMPAATRPVGDTRSTTRGADEAVTGGGTPEIASVDAAAGDTAAVAGSASAVPPERLRATGSDRLRQEPVVAASARSEAPPEGDGVGAVADGAATEATGPSRAAGTPAARAPSEPIVNRIVALVERLRAEPPPRQMVVDLESLGAGRLVVTLRGDTVVVGPLNPGASHDQQWLEDLDEALGARGWSLDHRRERSSPQDRRPRQPRQPWRTPTQPDHARADDGLRL